MSAISVEDVIGAAGDPAVLTDFRRDHNDRPLIVPPDGGKAIAYSRASSIGKLIDDTYNLEKWARRNVAFGMAHDASLVASLLAEVGTPQTWSSEQKAAVDGIVKRAEGVAQAHKGADIGTALHKLTEHLDNGVEVQAGPYAGDLAAYRAELDRWGIIIVPGLIECRLVCDALQVAGTCDRLVLVRPGSALARYLRLDPDEHVVADLKTGSVEYGALSYGTQLAPYAHGELYDLARDIRLPTPKVNRRRGIIIHLPAGEGRCALHLVDLEAGYRAAQLATVIRATRSEARGWMTSIEDAAPLPTTDEELPAALAASLEVDPDVIAAAVVQLRARLNAAVAAGARNVRWPLDVPTFKEGGPSTWPELLQVERVIVAAEAEAEMPFDAPSLPVDPNAVVEPEPEAEIVVLAERQPALDGDSMETLRDLHAALPVDLQHAAFAAVIAAGLPTDRRLWKVGHREALTHILSSATAEHDRRKAVLASSLQELDDDLVIACIRAVAPPLADVDEPLLTLGEMSADQVAAMVALAEGLDRGDLGARLDDMGVMEIIPAAPADDLFQNLESKAAVLAAAKDLATLHGRPKPRSAAAAATDPVLVALLLAGTPDNS